MVISREPSVVVCLVVFDDKPIVVLEAAVDD